MSKRRDFEYVVDIIDSMLDALEFLENLTEDQFYLDKKTQSAVIYKIQVIGEASKQISDALKQKYPLIPWKVMAGMRDVLIHKYHGVDSSIVWETANKLPDLLIELKLIIK